MAVIFQLDVFEFLGVMLPRVFFALACFALALLALYFVIRRAVRDGILDARKRPQCPIDLALEEDVNWP